MKKLVIGILAMIMVLAIVGAASAHDKWVAISDVERKLEEAGYKYVGHVDMPSGKGLPTVLLAGGLDVGDELCGYEVTFLSIGNQISGDELTARLKKLDIEIDKAHKPVMFEGINQITITILYMKIGEKNIPIVIVPTPSGDWAREIK